MRWLKTFYVGIILGVFFAGMAFSQSNLPSLAQIKSAAENGDAKAEDQLADAYGRSVDYANAFIWYRKAAEQGVANSQYHLGKMLLNQGYDFTFRKIISHEKIDEAVKWYLLSARQRYQLAEIELARLYKDGQFVKKDYTEAYKWYSLAHDVPGLEVLAKVYRDQLILKMSREQINEGQKKFETFLVTKGTDDPLPLPSFMDHLKLSGISGSGKHLFAIINNHTFEAGEEAQVKIDGRKVVIRCLEIRKDSVLIKVDAGEKPVELKLS
jgi:tetratricopeptide (TPR) repeat protein